jgi:hypothetical protein
MTTLADTITQVSERLRERQGATLAELHDQWTRLHLNLGRAAQAASAGDVEETRRWLTMASDAEYDLLGDCEQVAAVLEWIEQPIPAPESPPPTTPSTIDWERLEREVTDRIRVLQASLSSKVSAPPDLRDRIYQDLVIPNVRLLGEFCMNVQIEEEK